MLRKIILKGNEEWTLPVTPKTYSVESGKDIQVLDVYEVGEYTIPANPTLQTIKLEIMLPADTSSFAGGQSQSQWIEWLTSCSKDHAKIRFIVSGTNVNVPCYVQSFEYGEKDGTNDVYASLALREYTTLDAVEVQTTQVADNTSRADDSEQTAETTYTVEDGDTLWGIAKKYYGDGGLCYKLAAYNGIANANLITTGRVIKIPTNSTLEATQATQSAASAGSAPASTTKATTTVTLPSRSVTVRFSPPDVTKGICQYRWTNPKDCATESGKLPGTISVPHGAKLTVNWQGKNSNKSSGIVLDGKASASTGSLTLSVAEDHTLIIRW